MTTKDRLIGIRDPHENRPLYVARIAGSFFFSSEQRVIDELMYIANYRMKPSDMLWEVKGGEIFVIKKGKEEHTPEIRELKRDPNHSMLIRCSFSESYLKRADERNVYEFRRRCGEKLFEEHPIEKTEKAIIAGVSDSGLIAAEAYAAASFIGLVYGIRRDPYFQRRTFIEPYHHGREIAALMKYYTIRGALEGKIAVLIDDSIVRATTTSNLIKLMRLRGKVEGIHMRIATPPYVTPCWLGIHTPEKESLVANGVTPEQLELFFMARFFGVDYDMMTLKKIVKKEHDIRKIVGQSIIDKQNYLTDKERGHVDPKRFSLRYLSLDGFKQCFQDQQQNMCYACFIPDGKGYPNHMQPYLVGKV